MSLKKDIKVKINGQEYLGVEGQSILDLAQANDIFIPSLCHHPDLKIKANCRVCVVEDQNSNKLLTACSTPIKDGLDILTDSEKVKQVRDTNLKLIFAEHIEKCFDCTLKFDCTLLDLARRYNIKITNFSDRKGKRPTYKFAQAVELDGSQCIDCQNCLEVCSDIQKINYLKLEGQAYQQEVKPTEDPEIDCIYCGQCTLICPVASAQEQASWPEIEKWLADKNDQILIALVAPASRFSIGEEFGYPIGENHGAKLITALKDIGFNYVMDVNFGADITTLVESEELLERLNNPDLPRPLLSSCCPAWVKYLEFYRPELIANLTSARSPHIHLGGVIKTYWASKMGLDPKKIKIVSIMPCTAKKYEIEREELKINSNKIVDQVITVRETTFLLKKRAIDLKSLADSDYDNPFSSSSGSAQIYGASGGVMEAALRTAEHIISSDGAKEGIGEFKELRGSENLKILEFKLGEKILKVAVVNGIGNIKMVLDNLSDYDYLEVMACPGGCLGGGGQPLSSNKEILEKRRLAIYQSDANNSLKRASDNPLAKEVIAWVKDNNLADQVLFTKYSKKVKK